MCTVLKDIFKFAYKCIISYLITSFLSVKVIIYIMTPNTIKVVDGVYRNKI